MSFRLLNLEAVHTAKEQTPEYKRRNKATGRAPVEYRKVQEVSRGRTKEREPRPSANLPAELTAQPCNDLEDGYHER